MHNYFIPYSIKGFEIEDFEGEHFEDVESDGHPLL
jgi:hypothetical protein